MLWCLKCGILFIIQYKEYIINYYIIQFTSFRLAGLGIFRKRTLVCQRENDRIQEQFILKIMIFTYTRKTLSALTSTFPSYYYYLFKFKLISHQLFTERVITKSLGTERGIASLIIFLTKIQFQMGRVALGCP